MTLEEARAELIRMSQLDLDLYKGIELDADGNAVEELEGANALLTQAVQDWQKWTFCSFNPSVALTLEATEDTYDLRDTTIVSVRVLKPRSVVINSSTLYRPDGAAGVWTMEELRRYRPTWRDYDDAVPTAAVWYDNRYLLLSAPPAATYSGLNFIEAWTIIGDYTAANDDDDLPGLPEDHHYIVERAAVIGSMYHAVEGHARNRIAEMDKSCREFAQRRKQENLAGFVGKRPKGWAARDDWMQ